MVLEDKLQSKPVEFYTLKTNEIVRGTQLPDLTLKFRKKHSQLDLMFHTKDLLNHGDRFNGKELGVQNGQNVELIISEGISTIKQLYKKFIG